MREGAGLLITAGNGCGLTGVLFTLPGRGLGFVIGLVTCASLATRFGVTCGVIGAGNGLGCVPGVLTLPGKGLGFWDIPCASLMARFGSICGVIGAGSGLGFTAALSTFPGRGLGFCNGPLPWASLTVRFGSISGVINAGKGRRLVCVSEFPDWGLDCVDLSSSASLAILAGTA